jgi:hypothetical protein
MQCHAKKAASRRFAQGELAAASTKARAGFSNEADVIE